MSPLALMTFAANRVAGVTQDEKPHYWRDIGTLAALAAAQQDVQGEKPRSRMSNPQWPLPGGKPAARISSVAAAVEPFNGRVRSAVFRPARGDGIPNLADRQAQKSSFVPFQTS